MNTLFDDIVWTSGRIELPRSGVWIADLIFPSPSAPAVGRRGTLKIDSTSLVGTVISSTAIDPGRWRVTVAGGVGSMTTPRSAFNMVNKGLRAIVTELLAGSSEQLGTLDPKAAAFFSQQWEIAEGVPRGIQLTRLLQKVGPFVWRIASDGKVTITADAAPTTFRAPKEWSLQDVGVQGDLVYQAGGAYVHASPGQLSEQGWMIEGIVINIDSTRTTVTLERSTLAQINDQLNARLGRNAFVACYPCRIDGQNSDGPFGGNVGGTLRLTPDDARIRGKGMDKVPIRGPGHFLQRVHVGDRCFVQFDADDPGRPFVSGFEQSTSSDFLHVIGDPGAAQFVALANLVKAELDDIKADLDAMKGHVDGHIHTTTATVGASPTVGVISPPTTSAPTPHTPGDVASTNLKTT